MKTFLSVGEAMVEMSSADGENWRMGFAGDTLNTAWYVRRQIGTDWRVSYFTALGADRYSGMMRKFMVDAGLCTDDILTIADRRAGLYFIHQQDGDRHFTYWRDRSAAKLLAQDADLLGSVLARADHIYFSGITLAILEPEHRAALLDALAKRRAAGATICFDPNIRPKLWSGEDEIRDWLTRATSVCDIALPTFGDEAEIFGDASRRATADRYANVGASEVVVKDGSNASLALVDGAASETLPAAGIEVVDATGAGDSFNGAYLAARIRGLAPDAAMARAHSIAAVCITHRGAIPAR